MNKDGLCKVDAGNLGTCDDEAHNLNECSICSRVCVSFLSDIFCMNFKISHVNDYCICILYVALQRLELRAMVCGSPPSLSAAAPPSNLASSAWAFDRLNAPRHKPKQSLSIDIDRSERTHHWLQLLQFLEEEHHHRKLAQAFAVRSCVLSYPRWKTCIKLFH